MMKLEIGDKVAWSSQGRGHWKEKVGTVTGFITIRGQKRPKVSVPSELKRGVPKIYYPWPSVLRKLN